MCSFMQRKRINENYIYANCTLYIYLDAFDYHKEDLHINYNISMGFVYAEL